MKITKSGPSFHEFKRQSDVVEFPDAFTRYIKSYGDTYYWEKGHFHVVTKADHAREILTSPAYSADRGSFFISRMPNMDLSLIQDFFHIVKKMMVMSDDSDHSRRRKTASAGFEDHILDRFKATMAISIKDIMKECQGKEAIEFVSAISKKLPSTVLADLFSIPQEDRENFLKWSNIMTGFFGGASEYRNEDGIEVNSAALSLKNYFIDLIRERRGKPGNDYVSIILQQQSEMGLDDDEILSQLIMMLVAGMATTTDQINNCMLLLATNPDIQKEVRSNKSLIPQMLEEFKRYDPAVTFIFRVARKPTNIGPQLVAPGDVIFISTHAINRDLPDEEKPCEININRKGAHFAYGHGPHYCIGAKLARMEMISLFEEIVTNLPPVKLDDRKKSLRDHYSLSFSGFKELHLEFL
ncbi:MAG: cytochrome P450 [Bacteriovoracia bacterium]